MSGHLAFRDDAETVYCPETEQTENLRFLGGDAEPLNHMCEGCSEFIDTPVPYAHHIYTMEDWNCNGHISEIADDDETCLGCGRPAKFATDNMNVVFAALEELDLAADFAYGRHA